MEIFEAYDATGSLRGAAALAGCDTQDGREVGRGADAAGGGLPDRARQLPLVDPFAAKIDQLVDRSRALVRADGAWGVGRRMDYQGSYRTTRRAVAEANGVGATSTARNQAVDSAAGVVAAVGIR